MLPEIIILSIVIGFIILSIYCRYNITCPKCDGKMKDIGTHNNHLDGITIYKCVECKEEWI